MKKLNKTLGRFFLLGFFMSGIFAQPIYAQLYNKQDSLIHVKADHSKINLRKMNLKQYILPGSTMFISGLLDGTVESIKFHYESGFKPRFKQANDQFWNPDISWTNKYKNGCPADGPKFYGSTNALVFTTDAYHSLRTAKNLINTLTIAFYIDHAKSGTHKTTLKKVLLDALVLTTIRNIGFTTTYSILFRQRNP
ncbi:MAG: hypothetical protein ACXVPU_02555 [Bacteroidia bacterium]